MECQNICYDREGSGNMWGRGGEGSGDGFDCKEVKVQKLKAMFYNSK